MAKRHLSKRPSTSQSLDVAQELANLEQKTAGELAKVFEELFREPCRSRHKQWLIRRIIWRMQANIEGEDVSIVLLNSFGKLTPFGDSNRLRKWMLANS